VLPSGAVEARLVFASSEPFRGVRLDRDADGEVTAPEVAAAQDELRAFVADSIDVTSDGKRCAVTFRDATLEEIDGLVIRASYACPPGGARLAATLYYLSDLGRDHRELARISAGDGTTEEALLTRDRREIALQMPAPPLASNGGAARGNARAAGIGAALALLIASLGLWAWLRTRRRGA